MSKNIDPRGNIDKESYYDIKGSLTLDQHGIAIIKRSFDSKGNINSEYFFDTVGKPTIKKDGGYAGSKAEYSLSGQMKSHIYLDTQGKPTLNIDGYARIDMDYDRRGNRTEVAVFDANNKPTLNKYGWFRVRLGFDNEERDTDYWYYDINNKPTLMNDGYFHLKFTYDSQGRETKISYYDNEEKPIIAGSTKCASQKYSYDPLSGNTIEIVCLNENGNLMTNIDGVARQTYESDEKGNLKELNNYSPMGFRTVGPNGIAKAKYKHDKYGNVLERRFYGVDNLITSGINLKYDETGNAIRAITVNGLGQEILTSGYSKTKRRYNIKRQVIEESYYDIHGKPALANHCGCAKIISKYDTQGNLIEYSFWGKDDQLILHNELNAARVIENYDERSRRVRTVFYGTDEKLILSKFGYAESKGVFDVDNKQIETSFFGVNKEPIILKEGNAKGGYARQIIKLDERYRPVEEIFFGNKDNRILNNDGFASLIRNFDTRGNISSVSFYGVDKQPILNKLNFAKQTWTYDIRGRKLHSAFFDTNDNLVLNSDGFSIIKWNYLPGGNFLISYLDKDGKPSFIWMKKNLENLFSSVRSRPNETSMIKFETELVKFGLSAINNNKPKEAIPFLLKYQETVLNKAAVKIFLTIIYIMDNQLEKAAEIYKHNKGKIINSISFDSTEDERKSLLFENILSIFLTSFRNIPNLEHFIELVPELREPIEKIKSVNQSIN